MRVEEVNAKQSLTGLDNFYTDGNDLENRVMTRLNRFLHCNLVLASPQIMIFCLATQCLKSEPLPYRQASANLLSLYCRLGSEPFAMLARMGRPTCIETPG